MIQTTPYPRHRFIKSSLTKCGYLGNIVYAINGFKHTKVYTDLLNPMNVKQTEYIYIYERDSIHFY